MSSSAAQQLGFSRHAVANKVRQGRWQRLVRGVYLTNSGSPTPDDWMRAALIWAGPNSVLTGIAALSLLGIRFDLPGAPLVVLVPHNCSRRSTGRMVVRHTTRMPTPRLLDGIPVAPAARSVVEACQLIRDITTTRDIATSAVGQRLCTTDMLERELAAAPKRGSAMLRRVLAEVATGAESVPECEAAEILRSAGITGFQQNVVLYDRVGNAIGRGDIVWEEERAVLEIDSLQWHSGPAEWRHTMRRHNRLEEAGYAVLHYPPSDIRRDPAAFAESVQHWLAERMRRRAS